MNRFFYTVLLWIVLPFTPIKLLWRARKQPDYARFWGERFGRFTPITNKTKPVIWLHCVSVGETMAAAPLVRALVEDFPHYQVLITHTTPTGRATSEQLFGDQVLRAYLPYDLPFAVNAFFNQFQPVLGLLMETELWFNLIAIAKSRDIPVLLVNARLSEKSARGYAKLGHLVRDGLNALSAIAAQTTGDAARLSQLRHQPEALPISVMGNIKFDVTAPLDASTHGAKLRQLLQSSPSKSPLPNAQRLRPIFLAASTRSLNGVDEESLVLDAVLNCGIADLMTVIVPRHPERFDAVAALLEKRGLRYLRRSQLHQMDAQSSQVDVLLGDSMGEMFSYYACCDVAFIGGSLLALGGQNLIEASAMAKPTLVGPHTFNFSQVVDFAIEAKATLRVNNVEELALTLRTLFNDAQSQQQMATNARAFCSQHRGATKRLLGLITPYLSHA